MPTKHIDAESWEKIEKLTVKAVITHKKPIKAGKILELVIKKGIQKITVEELNEVLKK